MKSIARRFVLAMAVLGLVAGGAGRADAAPVVTLSSPSDLNQLTVGQQVQFNVSLAGISTNEFLFVLDTRELFPSNLFAPVSLSPSQPGTGSVFDTSAQVNSFLVGDQRGPTFLGAGIAQGNFSDTFPTPTQAIDQDGLYYSFTLQAIAAGSGVISFDPAGTLYASGLTGFNLAPLPTGAPLQFTITGGPAVVPEPSTLALGGIGGLLALGYAWRRRRAA
jgi:hypothetical protein